MRERNKRESHILNATMHSARFVEQSILVRNLSSRGLGARTRGAVPVEGEEVHLQLDGRSLVGRVRWVRGERFGIHLRDPVHLDARGPTRLSDEKKPTPGFQVLDCFRPVEKPWRPSVSGWPQEAGIPVK